MHSHLRFFADDCLAYRPINSPDHKIFQDDIFKLSEWANAWQVSQHSAHYHNFTYTMYSIPLLSNTTISGSTIR